LGDVIVQAFRKQRRLMAIFAFDKPAHPLVPQLES
jgi:hypothetical protein